MARTKIRSTLLQVARQQ